MVEDSCWSTASVQIMRSVSGPYVAEPEEDSQIDFGDLDSPVPSDSRKSPHFSPDTGSYPSADSRPAPESSPHRRRENRKSLNPVQGEASLRKLAFEEPFQEPSSGERRLSIPLPAHSVPSSAPSGPDSPLSPQSPADSSSPQRRKSQFAGGAGGRSGLALVRSASKSMGALAGRRKSRVDMSPGGPMGGVARGRKRMTLAGNHGVERMRVAVVGLYAECLEVARCRIQTKAAEAPRVGVHSGPQPRHAWPHLVVAPMLWLPFSLCPATFARFVVPTRGGAGVDLSKPYKQLAPMSLAVGSHHLHGGQLPSSHDSSDEDLARTEADDTGNHAKMKKLFQIAVSEAKLAQAQAVVAFRDVQSLRAALKPSCGHRGPGGSTHSRARHRTGGAGAGAAVAAGWTAGRSPNSSMQGLAPAAQGASVLQARREQLRKAEATIKATLRDVERQNARLMAELQRREATPSGLATPGAAGGRSASEQPTDRAATAPGSLLGNGSSPERPRAASAREERQALPTIGGSPPSAAASGTTPKSTPRATPRATQVAAPPTPRRAALAKTDTGLPHLAPGCHPHMRRAQH